MKDAINNHVRDKRAEEGIDYQKHAGMYQSELKLRWDGLSSSEKRIWDEKAALMVDSDGQKIYW